MNLTLHVDADGRWEALVEREDGEVRAYTLLDAENERQATRAAIRAFKFETSFDPPDRLTEEDKRQPIPWLVRPEDRT